MILQWTSTFEAGTMAWVSLDILAILVLFVPGWLLYHHSQRSSPAAGPGLENVAGLATVLVVVWMLWGYTLAFGPSLGTVPSNNSEADFVHASMDELMEAQHARVDRSREIGRGGFLGGLDYAMLQEMSPEGSGTGTVYSVRVTQPGVPHAMFFLVQLGVFLAFTMSFTLPLWGALPRQGVVLVGVVWSAAVYAPVAHSVWGDGWLHVRGAIDKGGGLLALATACSAVTACLIVRRRGASAQHSVSASPLLAWLGSMLVLGGALFVHCSSNLHPGGATAQIFLSTIVAGAAGALAFSGTARFLGHSDGPGALSSGLVSGVVSVSAGAGVVVPQSAFVLGLAGGAVAAVVSLLRAEPATRAWLAQAASAIVGLLGAGFFAVSTITAPGQLLVPGWIESGSVLLLGHQALAVAATIALSVGGTAVLVAVAARFGRSAAVSA